MRGFSKKVRDSAVAIAGCIKRTNCKEIIKNTNSLNCNIHRVGKILRRRIFLARENNCAGEDPLPSS